MEAFIQDVVRKFWKPPRVLEMQRLAETYGFDFSERERFEAQNLTLARFELFKGKKAKRLSGILTAQKEGAAKRVRIYDYIYYGEGKKRKTTVYELRSGQIDLDYFLIRPKGALAWMKNLFSGEKIFESMKDFHSNYSISSRELDIIKLQLNEEFLEMVSRKNGLYVEGEGDFLIVYYRHKQIPHVDVMDEYEFSLALLDRLIHGISAEEFV